MGLCYCFGGGNAAAAADADGKLLQQAPAVQQSPVKGHTNGAHAPGAGRHASTSSSSHTPGGGSIIAVGCARPSAGPPAAEVTAAWAKALTSAQAEVAAAEEGRSGTFVERYVPLAVIGQGTASRVLRVRRRRGVAAPANASATAPATQYAVRVVRNLGTQAQMQALTAEVAVHRLLSGHAHVASLEEVLMGPREIYLVMELCDGPDLAEHLSEVGLLSERTAANVLGPLLSLAAAAHRCGIVLRNLQPDCVRLSDRGPSAVIKMVNFRLSAFCEPGGSVTGCVGMPAFAAPQVLLRQPYDTLADCWSIGVLACLLLTGRNPYQGVSITDTLERVTRGRGVTFASREWAHVSNDAKGLVAAMLTHDPAARPTAAEALTDPWLREAPTSALGEHVVAQLRAYCAQLRVQRLARLALAHALLTGAMEGASQYGTSMAGGGGGGAGGGDGAPSTGPVSQRSRGGSMGGAAAGSVQRLKEMQAIFAATDRNKDARLSATELYRLVTRGGSGRSPRASADGGGGGMSGPAAGGGGGGARNRRGSSGPVAAVAEDDDLPMSAVPRRLVSGLDQNSFKRLFAGADLDGSGGLDREEFAAALLDADALIRADDVRRRLYEALDLDGDGFLSAEEVAVALGAGGGGPRAAAARASAAELMAEYDKNKDGMLDMEEFAAMYRARTLSRKRGASSGGGAKPAAGKS